jgi:hypothetical protein
MTPRLARDEVERHIPPHLEPLRREAALLTTELVTNAVIHGRSVVDLDLYVDDDGLCLSVVDFGPGVPAIRDPDQNGGGYGLHLVDKLATRWGHERLDPQGKRVWFELHLERGQGFGSALRTTTPIATPSTVRREHNRRRGQAGRASNVLTGAVERTRRCEKGRRRRDEHPGAEGSFARVFSRL